MKRWLALCLILIPTLAVAITTSTQDLRIGQDGSGNPTWKSTGGWPAATRLSGTPTLCRPGYAARGITAFGNHTGCFLPAGGGGDVSGKLDVSTFNSYSSVGGGRSTEQYTNDLNASEPGRHSSDSATTLRVGIVSDVHYRASYPNTGLAVAATDMQTTTPIDVLFGAGDIGYDTTGRLADMAEWGLWRQQNITAQGILWQSALGNHDIWNGPVQTTEAQGPLRAAWIAANGEGYPGSKSNTGVFLWQDLVIITLGYDNVAGSRPSDAILDELEHLLQLYAGRKVLVVAHLPPVDSGLSSSSYDISIMGAANTRVKTICQTYPILAWFSGHIHYDATGGDPGDVLISSPSGYGGTKFYGIPNMRDTAAVWVYFASSLGDSSIAVRYRNSTTGAWLTQWDSTITLPSSIAPTSATLSWGHLHRNKSQLDDMAISGKLDLTAADIPGGAQLTLENSSSATAAHSPGFTITNYRGAQTSGSPVITFKQALGSKASPTVIGANVPLLQMTAQGYDGTGFVTGAHYEILSESGWDSSAHTTFHRWRTYGASDSLSATKMRLMSGGDLIIGASSLVNTNGSKLLVDGDIETTTGVRFPNGVQTAKAPPIDYDATSGTLTLPKMTNTSAYRIWVTSDAGSPVFKVYQDGTTTTGNISAGTIDATSYLLNGVAFNGTNSLITGVSGGQTIAFDTASGADTGVITSTTHATKGGYYLNAAKTIRVNEATASLYVGVASPPSTSGVYAKFAGVGVTGERASTSATNATGAAVKATFSTTQTATNGFGPAYSFSYIDAVGSNSMGSVAAVLSPAGSDLVFAAGLGASGTEKMRVTQVTHMEFTGTVPTVASGSSDCGTSPAIAGNDAVGRITVGSSTNGGKCTMTFASNTWANAPICTVQNETTANLVRPVGASTTSVAFTGTLVAGDKLVYHCYGYR